MIGKGFVFGGALVLGACGAASATPPDSSKPAHCIAAFHYARTIALHGQPANVSLAVESTARSLFEGRKLKAEGQFEDGQREGERLLAENAANDKVMLSLVFGCLTRQDADPDYRALNKSGALMAAARKVDPACREDAACRSRIQ